MLMKNPNSEHETSSMTSSTAEKRKGQKKEQNPELETSRDDFDL